MNYLAELNKMLNFVSDTLTLNIIKPKKEIEWQRL